MKKRVFLFLTFILVSSLSFAQSDTRLHSGIGLNNDVSSYFAVDYGNYLLNEDSKFNIGAQLGGYFYNFNNDRLSRDSKLYGSLAFSLKYQISNKWKLQVDSGSKFALGKPNVSFLDQMNNEIPDSDIGNHAFTMPLLEYSINSYFGAFLGYHFVFEKELDMDTLSFGLRLNL
ncbi:MAG: hypothetical protein ACI9WL_000402 [Rubritalea sp.]|jgi:hypothetical protein